MSSANFTARSHFQMMSPFKAPDPEKSPRKDRFPQISLDLLKAPSLQTPLLATGGPFFLRHVGVAGPARVTTQGAQPSWGFSEQTCFLEGFWGLCAGLFQCLRVLQDSSGFHELSEGFAGSKTMVVTLENCRNWAGFFCGIVVRGVVLCLPKGPCCTKNTAHSKALLQQQFATAMLIRYGKGSEDVRCQMMEAFLCPVWTGNNGF